MAEDSSSDLSEIRDLAQRAMDKARKAELRVFEFQLDLERAERKNRKLRRQALYWASALVGGGITWFYLWGA